MLVQGYKKILAFYRDCFAVPLIATQQCLALLTETETSTKLRGRGRYLYGIVFFTSTVSTVICEFLAWALFKTLPISLPAFSPQGLCLQVVCDQGTGEEGSDERVNQYGNYRNRVLYSGWRILDRNARRLLHGKY